MQKEMINELNDRVENSKLEMQSMKRRIYEQKKALEKKVQKDDGTFSKKELEKLLQERMDQLEDC